MDNQYGARGLDVMSGVRDSAALPTQGRGTQATFSTQTKTIPGVLDKHGRPMVVTSEYVTMYIAGDRKSSMVHRLKPEYRDAFLRERGLEDAYARWKTAQDVGAEFVGEGMPLTQWAAVTREQVEIMRFHRIFTVEQLADAHDGAIANLGMGFTELREVARKWIEQSRTTGANTMIRREVDNLASENAELQKRLAQMQAEMNAMKKLAKPANDGQENPGANSPQSNYPLEPPSVKRVRVDREPEPVSAVVDSGVERLPSGFGADAGADLE